MTLQVTQIYKENQLNDPIVILTILMQNAVSLRQFMGSHSSQFTLHWQVRQNVNFGPWFKVFCALN